MTIIQWLDENTYRSIEQALRSQQLPLPGPPAPCSKILAACPAMPNRNAETVGRKQKSSLIIFTRQKGNTVDLTPQEVCPSSLRKRERFHSLMKVLYFFFLSFSNFQNGHSWPQATQQWDLVSLKLSTHDLLSET